MKQVGVITARVIQLLELNIPPDTPIFLGETNVAHMEAKHGNDYRRYGERIEEIIAAPTYVGYKKGSIEYIKELSEYVKIAVRVSSDGTYFVRTIYAMNPDKVENFLIKLKKWWRKAVFFH